MINTDILHSNTCFCIDCIEGTAIVAAQDELSKSFVHDWDCFCIDCFEGINASNLQGEALATLIFGISK